MAENYNLNVKANYNGAALNRGIDTTSKKMTNLTSVTQGLGAAFGATFGVIGAGMLVKSSIGIIADFDEEIVNMAAIMGKTRDEAGGLEKEIRKVAESSRNTAGDVAKMATALFTLGKTESEVKVLLKPVNDLSIALRASADEAGELLIGTLNAFGKSSDSAQEYADIIAKTRTTTALDFQRMKDALSFVAPTAAALGLTLQKTNAILGTLSDNSIKASRAGRLLSSSFARLNANGMNLNQALDQIKTSSDKTKTATELFGTESFTLGLILANNIEKINAYDKSLGNAQGTLNDLTTKQLSSLNAKADILKATWDELLISFDKTPGVIGGVVDGATGFLKILTAAKEGTIDWGDALTAMTDPIQLVTQLSVLQAKKAKESADAEKEAQSIKTQAQYLYEEALENGMDTWDKYSTAGALALSLNINKTEILALIQEKYNAVVDETAAYWEKVAANIKKAKEEAGELARIGAKPTLTRKELDTPTDAEKRIEEFTIQGQAKFVNPIEKEEIDNIFDAINAYVLDPTEFNKKVAQYFMKIDEGLRFNLDKISNSMFDFGVWMEGTVEESIISTATVFGDALAEALIPDIGKEIEEGFVEIEGSMSKGETILRKMGGGLLGILGENLQGMGAALVASGVALSALGSMNPAVQVAAGVAAIAAGAMVKRLAAKNAAAVSAGSSSIVSTSSLGGGSSGGGGRATFTSTGQSTEFGGNPISTAEDFEKVLIQFSDLFDIDVSDFGFGDFGNFSDEKKPKFNHSQLFGIEPRGLSFNQFGNFSDELKPKLGFNNLIKIKKDLFKFSHFGGFTPETLNPQLAWDIPTVDFPGITGGSLPIHITMDPVEMIQRGPDLRGALRLTDREFDRTGTFRPNFGG